MGIISLTPDVAGQTGNLIGGVAPRRVAMVTSDSLATITTAGYLNNVQREMATAFYPTDVFQVFYNYVSPASPGTYDVFTLSFSNGVITMVPDVAAGNVLLPVVSGDFANFNGTTGQIKDSGFSPSNAAKTKVVMANGATVVNHIMVSTDITGTSGNLTGTAINDGSLQAGRSGVQGNLIAYPAGALAGRLLFSAIGNTGDFTIQISNAIYGQATVLTIPDPGAASANFVLDNLPAGQTIFSTTSSAAPGSPIRALTGSMIQSAAVMTSGNVVGVRGVVNCVGASGGFIYGTQGKVISTGTLSGSVWVPAIFGQLDVSAATINGGQVSALWGDWGTTGAVASDMTGTSGIKFTNTTSNVLNSQLDTYGDASFLWNIRGNPGPLAYYLAAGTSAGSAGDAAHCAAQQVLKIVVQGATVYIPVFTQNT